MSEDRVRRGNVRIGVDIGGTFTDLLMFDDSTGSFTIGKTLTTPSEPAAGVRKGLTDILTLGDQAPETVRQIVHGTTLVTNALIERKGAKTALITTAGFRDA